MQLRPQYDSQGNIIGVETIDDEGNVVSQAQKQFSSQQPIRNVQGSSPIGQIEGDFRSSAERRADANAAKKASEEEDEESYTVPDSVRSRIEGRGQDAKPERRQSSERPASDDVMGPAFTNNAAYNKNVIFDDNLEAQRRRGGFQGAVAGVFQGGRNIARGVIDAAEDVTDFGAAIIDTVRGIEVDDTDNFFNPSARVTDPRSAIGSFTKEAVSFGATSVAVGGLASKIPAVAKLAAGGVKSRLAYSAGVGAVTDFVKAKPAEENLFNALEGTGLETNVSRFLAADTDEDANIWMAKTKEVIGGVILGVSFDLFGEGVTQAAKALKQEPFEQLLRGIRNAKKLPEEAQEAALRETDKAVSETIEKTQLLLAAAVDKEVGERITDARRLLAPADDSKRGFAADTKNPAIKTIDVDNLPTTLNPIKAGGSPDAYVERLKELEEELTKLSDIRRGLFEMNIDANTDELDKVIFEVQDEFDAFTSAVEGLSTPVSDNLSPSPLRGVLQEQLNGPRITRNEALGVASPTVEDLVDGADDIMSKPIYQPPTETRRLDEINERLTEIREQIKNTEEPNNVDLLNEERGNLVSEREQLLQETTFKPQPQRESSQYSGEGVGRKESLTEPFEVTPQRASQQYSGEGIGRVENTGTPVKVGASSPLPNSYRTKPEIRKDIAVKRVSKKYEPKTTTVEAKTTTTKAATPPRRKVSVPKDTFKKYRTNNESVGRFMNYENLSSSQDIQDAAQSVMESIDQARILDKLSDSQLQRRASNMVRELSFLSDKDADGLLNYYMGLTVEAPAAQLAIREMARDLGEQLVESAKSISSTKKLKDLSIGDLESDAELAYKMSRFVHFVELNKNLGAVQAQGLRARGLKTDTASISNRLAKADYDATYKKATEVTSDPSELKDSLMGLLATPDGRKKFERMSTDLKSAESMDEVVSTALANKFLSTQNLKKASGLVQGVRMNGILSGTGTNLTNVVANMATTLYNPLTRLVGAALDAPYQALRGNSEAFEVDKETIRHSLAMYTGFMQYLSDSSAMARKAFKQGKGIIGDDLTLKEADRFELLQDLNSDLGLAKLSAHALSMPSRLLVTGDEFFKQLNYRAFVRSEAMEEGLKNNLKGKRLNDFIDKTVKDSFKVDPNTGVQGLGLNPRANEYAEFVTMQTKVSKKMSDSRSYILGIVDSMHDKNGVPGVIGSFITSLFVPFIKTPANIVSYTARNSPLAAVSKEWRMDFSGANGPLKQKEALGQMAMGSTALAGVVSLAMQGKLTGRAPSDPGERELFYQAGYQPYSFKVGNKWVSFQRLEPFAGHFGIVADMTQSLSRLSKDDDKEYQQLAGATLGAFIAAMKNRTFFEGFSDITRLIDGIGNPDPRHKNTVSGVLTDIGTTLLPYSSFLNEQRKARDLTIREAEGFNEKLMNKIPGFSTELPAKRYWLTGKPMQYSSNPIMNLYPSSQISNDPLIKNLYKYNLAITPPDKKIKEVELTNEQYSDLLNILGTIQDGEGKTMYDRMLEVFDRTDLSVLDAELDYIQANDEYARTRPIYADLSGIRKEYLKRAEAELTRLYPEVYEQNKKLMQDKEVVKEGMFWLNNPLYLDEGFEPTEEVLEKVDGIDETVDDKLDKLLNP